MMMMDKASGHRKLEEEVRRERTAGGVIGIFIAIDL